MQESVLNPLNKPPEKVSQPEEIPAENLRFSSTQVLPAEEEAKIAAARKQISQNAMQGAIAAPASTPEASQPISADSDAGHSPFYISPATRRKN
ncbi:MAG: hypothetical protein WDN67_02650 [Candidatus Moraniibacteriota bacterium]